MNYTFEIFQTLDTALASFKIFFPKTIAAKVTSESTPRLLLMSLNFRRLWRGMLLQDLSWEIRSFGSKVSFPIKRVSNFTWIHLHNNLSARRLFPGRLSTRELQSLRWKCSVYAQSEIDFGGPIQSENPGKKILDTRYRVEELCWNNLIFGLKFCAKSINKFSWKKV